MKKLITLAALIAVAGAAHSASFFWGAEGLSSLNPDPADWGYAAPGALVYLYEYTGGGSFGDGGFNWNDLSLTADNATSGTLLQTFADAYDWASGTIWFNYVAPEAVINTTYALVWYDVNGSPGTYGVDVFTVAGLLDTSPAPTFGPASIDAGSFEAVPEPATGMLALAGAAMLLRRRRRA